MLIEVRNAAFVNKGAELMLRAIVERIRQSLPDAKLSMVPPLGYESFLQRAELGLYQKILQQGSHVKWGFFESLLPKRFRQMYGMVLDAEIDVVLDASGFAYSDQWGRSGRKVSVEAAKSIKKWKNQGTKVIFMPQAFGPFTDDKTREAFKLLVEHADIMYPRDEVSYKHVIDVAGKRENVKIAPDFTNLIHGELPLNFDLKANRFCIIPNYRMIDKAGEKQSENYMPFLISCARYLQEKGAKPFILIHEGDNDLWLGQQVAKGLGREINIVRETNALFIKGIIGASSGVISSRFHGLVSALSQGVPALATGWSHKYEMLFQDYGFKEGVLSVSDCPKDIGDKIDLLISDTSRQQLILKITDAAEKQKAASFTMWNEVLSIIRKS